MAEEVKRQLWEEMQEFVRTIKTDTGRVEVKELTEPQVVLEQSPVGESQSNGRVESAIGRVKGQIRALKLDVEANYKTKLSDSHPIWPWLIEYAAQTLHVFGATREDGLSPAQRIRGKTAQGPRARIGEKVVYKHMKTVRPESDTEQKMRYAIGLGVKEHTETRESKLYNSNNTYHRNAKSLKV